MFYGRTKSGLRPANAATAVPRRCVRTIPARCKIVLNGTDDNDTWHEISRMKRRSDFPVSHRVQGVPDPTPESSGRPYQIMRDTSRATFLVRTRLCSSARQLEALEVKDERLSKRDFGCRDYGDNSLGRCTPDCCTRWSSISRTRSASDSCSIVRPDKQ